MQIPLDLAFKPSYQREDYIVNDQNKAIINRLDCWPDWQSPWLLIEGSKGSGKTHLAHIFSQKFNGVYLKNLSMDIEQLMIKVEGKSIVIDCSINADKENQNKLFHLINHVKEQKQYGILFTEPMDDHEFVVLADLLSRLSQMPRFRLEMPDDALLKALIVKLFSDRQLKVAEAQVNWMLPRVRRSFEFVEKFVDIVDKASLARKKSITQSLLKKELEALLMKQDLSD